MDKVWKKNLIILFICLIIGGIIGIVHIWPVEFDFLNYRYYNGWAFWNNRYDIDIMPATFRTYFNPLIDAFNFLLLDRLNNHPYLYLFISGFKFGLFMFFSYLIYNFVLLNEGFERKFLIFSALILTAFSPIVLFTSGYGYNDMQPALLILLSIYLYCITIFEDKNKKNTALLFSSALIIGMVVGLKYTQGIFALTIILCTIFYHKSVKQPVKSIITMLCGMFIGFLITDGFWMYLLWKHFKNPFFPYFNSFFQSPMADLDAMFKTDFAHLRPNNLIEFIFAPLRNPLQINRGIEIPYFDLKIQFTFISLCIYFILCKFTNVKKYITNIVKPDIFNIIVFITITSYYINLLVFGNIRYVLCLFAFAPLIILVTCSIFYSNNKFKNTEPSIYNIIFALLICFYFISKPMQQIGDSLEIVAQTLVIFYFVFIIINYFSKKIENSYKNIYITTSLFIIIVFLTTRFIDYPMEYLAFYKAAQIKNLKIEDNSNVICATMLTNFIIPKQNPKAHYYGLSIPIKYQGMSYWTKESPFKNMLYKNSYLEKQLKKAFQEKNDLYFVYSWHGIAWGQDIEMYNNVLKYYSNNKIKKLKNCKKIPVQFFNHPSNYGDYYICKLK